VVGCLKHFPGLGAARSDPHDDLPVINRDRDQIESVELAPYRSLIAAVQAQCIMSTDFLMPALDPNMPAELAPTIINGVLRGELGFDGVVITDALYMGASPRAIACPRRGCSPSRPAVTCWKA
jgi:beta-N-acetylhexosaminidase